MAIGTVRRPETTSRLSKSARQPAKIIALDEPLGALDALTRIEMRQLIESLWRRQQFTTVLITHDVEEAVVLADRVVLIEEGRIAMDRAVPFRAPSTGKCRSGGIHRSHPETGHGHNRNGKPT